MFPKRLVGVDVLKVFLLAANVFWRSSAKDIGSPSLPALRSYLSTSSITKNLIGLLAKLAAELEPARTMYMPSNCSSNIFDSSSVYLLRSDGDNLSMGCNLFLLVYSASSRVG